MKWRTVGRFVWRFGTWTCDHQRFDTRKLPLAWRFVSNFFMASNSVSMSNPDSCTEIGTSPCLFLHSSL